MGGEQRKYTDIDIVLPDNPDQAQQVRKNIIAAFEKAAGHAQGKNKRHFEKLKTNTEKLFNHFDEKGDRFSLSWMWRICAFAKSRAKVVNRASHDKAAGMIVDQLVADLKAAKNLP